MRRFRRFRKSVPVQWVPAAEYSPTVAVPGIGGAANTTYLDVLIDNRQSTAPSFGGVNVQRFTVRTIRGQLGFAAGVGGGVVSVGIAVISGNTSFSGGTLPDPTSVISADYPWMFLRHYPIRAAASTAKTWDNYDDLMLGTDVWVKSKRVLKPEEALVVIVRGNVTFNFFNMLRTLVSRVA